MFEWPPIRKHYFEIWIEFYTTDKAKNKTFKFGSSLSKT